MTCCDGTGWTGNPRVPCVEHYQTQGDYFAMSHSDDMAQREYEDRFAPVATMSEAHSEWHRNSGVPMGQPGCPQDACHPPEPDRVATTQSGVRCGNKADHWPGWEHHATAADVRECYADSGRFAQGQ